jgi:hypothetical protein
MPTKNASKQGLRRAQDGVRAGHHDWLAWAIDRLGGVKPAAEKLGVPVEQVKAWLDHGLVDAPFGQILRLSKLADIPVYYLERRLGFGPWRDKLPPFSSTSLTRRVARAIDPISGFRLALPAPALEAQVSGLPGFARWCRHEADRASSSPRS